MPVPVPVGVHIGAILLRRLGKVELFLYSSTIDKRNF